MGAINSVVRVRNVVVLAVADVVLFVVANATAKSSSHPGTASNVVFVAFLIGTFDAVRAQVFGFSSGMGRQLLDRPSSMLLLVAAIPPVLVEGGSKASLTTRNGSPDVSAATRGRLLVQRTLHGREIPGGDSRNCCIQLSHPGGVRRDCWASSPGGRVHVYDVNTGTGNMGSVVITGGDRRLWN